MLKESFANHDCPHCDGLGTVLAMHPCGDSEEYDCECLGDTRSDDDPWTLLGIVMTHGPDAALSYGEDDWSGALDDDPHPIEDFTHEPILPF